MAIATFFVVDQNLKKNTYKLRAVVNEIVGLGFQDITKSTYDNLKLAVIQNMVIGNNMPSINFSEGNLVVDLSDLKDKPNALIQLHRVILSSCVPKIYEAEAHYLIDKDAVDRYKGEVVKPTIHTADLAFGWVGWLDKHRY